jgi:serine/threonine protein kinase
MNTVTPISEASAELARILDAYLAARQAGENPSREQLLADHPEFAGELEDCLASLEFIVTAVSPDGLGGAAEVGIGSVALSAHPIGDFRLVREIGRGGMGVVYEAIQLSLSRRVALKMLPFAAVLDPKQVQRFKNEAQAAANLDHPNIVSVYSVGCDRGIHYYAMQFVEGQSLAEVVQQQRQKSGRAEEQQSGSGVEEQRRSGVEEERRSGVEEQRSSCSTTPPRHYSTFDTVPIAALSTLRTTNPREHFRRIAQWGIQAAEALHYAHEMGIVHRDIKPSNLLVDAHGHLWITDFGLATTQSDAGLTMTGDLLGTLRYMSPEQAAGDRAKIDYRTDIYSLGITLYELLSGQPAFADTDRKVLLRRILEDNPKLLRSIDATIPRDLETIVLKSTEKEPTARYDSAAELAADLARFSGNQPVKAHRPSAAYRIRMFARRNRVLVTMACIVFVSLVTGIVVATLGLLEARSAANREFQARQDLERRVYSYQMNLAYNAWNSGSLPELEDLLDSLQPKHGGVNPANNIEYRLLERLRKDCYPPTMIRYSVPVASVDYSRDGRFLAIGLPNAVELHDLSTGTRNLFPGGELEGTNHTLVDVGFCPLDNRIAAVGGGFSSHGGGCFIDPASDRIETIPVDGGRFVRHAS